MSHARTLLLALSTTLLLLTGCGSSQAPAVSSAVGGGALTPVATAKTTKICPGPEAEKQAIIAFFDAHEGDTIEFCEGKFDFANGLVMTGKKGITIKGQGKEKTFLRFAESNDQDGFNLNQMVGVTVQGLTIYDAPGNGLRIFRSDIVVVRDVKVGWSISDPVTPYGNYNPDPATWAANGAYAFYPVICHKVLIEDSISVGSSDAGVYVGQSSDILVRRTEAYHNVAGFEFENTYRAEFTDNYAHDNVGGFLVFDLPGRVQFGAKNLVHDNRSYNNNTPQFAPRGAIVAAVPSGTGILVLSGDQTEIYNNDIRDNNTVGIVIANYGLVDTGQSQKRFDFYPEGLHIYNNTLHNNGGSPQVPDPDRSPCNGPGGLPGPGDAPDCASGNAGILVTIIQLKNGGKSAQIVWDGGEDKPSGCTSIPKDNRGVALTQPNPNEPTSERYEARSDERGRPNLYQFDPEPECQYNAWKFKPDGTLKRPQLGMCVEGNTYTKAPGNFADNYANIHFSTADPSDPMNQVPADNAEPNDCPIVAAPLLPLFVPVLATYTPNPANDPRPSDALLSQVCGATQAGKVNFEALGRYNCPRLDQYGLFADASDPTKNPIGGVPYELNTALFTDYASKYRFIYLPPGEKARFQDSQNCNTLNIYDCYTATLDFPVGTVIAKTFSFKKGTAEDVIETRLLIKRKANDGSPLWVGFSYEWATENGKRVAKLRLEGATKSVSWDYPDEDPNAKNAAGERPRYTGSTANYAIPSAGACLLCHSGDDREAGTAPIGPKVRNLNRDNVYAGQTINQLAHMQSLGLLDLPAGKTPAMIEALPKWNVPGSGGDAAGSAVDVHRRTRAFLEVNCYHCHNSAGGAQNSGLRLDSFTNPMRTAQGICKPPIAAGKGADSGTYDIQAGNPQVSILLNRVASISPGIKMPPTARSVMQGESVELITDWITNVVGQFADVDANFCGSESNGDLPAGFLPVNMMPVIAPTPAQQAPFG